MNAQITVTLPEDVLRRAELLAQRMGRPVADLLAEAIELSLRPLGAPSVIHEEPPMPTVIIEDAQARLPELIAQLHPGEEIVITREQKPVARLIGAAKPAEKPRRRAGSLKGSVLYMAPDFDDPLEDFKEYM